MQTHVPNRHSQSCRCLGRPTIVNNVETYNNLPAIMLRGPEWYIGLSAGKSKDPGTKIYGASGKVKFPGLWELPFGTTARSD